MTRPPFLPLVSFTWRGLHAQKRLLPQLAFTAVCCLALALLPAFTNFPWRASAAIVVFTAFVALWWAQVDSLMAQNRPMLARLVPGHVAALQRGLVTQWLGFTAGFTGLATALTDLPDTPWWTHATLWAAVIGSASFVLVWLVRRPVWWLGLGVASMGLPTLLRHAGIGWPQVQAWASVPQQALPVLAWVGVLMALPLRQAIGQGGPAHRARAAGRQRMVQLSRHAEAGQGIPVRLQTGLVGVFERGASWLWRWLLRRSQGQPVRGAVPVGRLNLVLAGPSHWARNLALTGWLVLLFVSALALYIAFVPVAVESPLMPMRFGLCFAVFGIALSPVLQQPADLKARRREEGLLRLLPGVPSGGAWQRAWTAHLTRLFVCGWLLATAAMIGLALAMGDPKALPFIGGFAGACLPLMALTWSSRARQFTGQRGPLLRMSSMVAGTVGGGTADILQLSPWLTLPLGAALTLLLWLALSRPRAGMAALGAPDAPRPLNH